MSRYINLNTHSNFTQNETVVTPEEIVEFAVKDGANAVALTDFNSVDGLLAFSEAVQKHRHMSFKPIYGVQIYGVDTERASAPRRITILARNQDGLRNMYQIISLGYMKEVSKKMWPCVSYEDVHRNHNGILIGFECTSDDVRQIWSVDKDCCDDEIMKTLILPQYGLADFVEIKSKDYYTSKICDAADTAPREQGHIALLLQRIVGCLNAAHKKAVAANGSNCITKEDVDCFEIMRDGWSRTKADVCWFLTTEEMLEEYRFLGHETAQEIVLDNPNAITEMISEVKIPRNTQHPFRIENAENRLVSACKAALQEKYGDSCPGMILDRYTSELNNILSHGFASYYVLATMLVEKSKELGYLHSTRGCAGGSLIAYLLGITETNPLPPHLYCKKCKRVNFVDPILYPSGLDLNCHGEEVKLCRHCGATLSGDGHNIPVEFFAGIDGEKAPDFEFCFAPKIHRKLLNYLVEIVGKDKAFFAGTTYTISQRIADYLIKNYCANHDAQFSPAETKAIRDRLSCVCRSKGRHPGRIVILSANDDISDYTPVHIFDPSELQANRLPTTSVDYHSIRSGLTTIGVLNLSMLTKLKCMEEMTCISAKTIPYSEIDVSSFCSNGSSLGLPYFPFDKMYARRIVDAVAPVRFSDLVIISGFLHGSNVWTEKAKELIAAGIPARELIATCDDVMLTLIRHGIDRKAAFEIAELVRNGKAGSRLTAEQETILENHGIPEWYIGSMKKILYLSPKAHVTEYVRTDLRMLWYKMYHPAAFYAAMLSSYETAFDFNIFLAGEESLRKELDRICREMESDEAYYDWDVKEDQKKILELALECYQRRIVFLPADITKSDSRLFVSENGAIRIPSAPSATKETYE